MFESILPMLLAGVIAFLGLWVLQLRAAAVERDRVIKISRNVAAVTGAVIGGVTLVSGAKKFYNWYKLGDAQYAPEAKRQRHKLMRDYTFKAGLKTSIAGFTGICDALGYKEISFALASVAKKHRDAATIVGLADDVSTIADRLGQAWSDDSIYEAQLRQEDESSTNYSASATGNAHTDAYSDSFSGTVTEFNLEGRLFANLGRFSEQERREFVDMVMASRECALHYYRSRSAYFSGQDPPAFVNPFQALECYGRLGSEATGVRNYIESAVILGCINPQTASSGYVIETAPCLYALRCAFGNMYFLTEMSDDNHDTVYQTMQYVIEDCYLDDHPFGNERFTQAQKDAATDLLFETYQLLRLAYYDDFRPLADDQPGAGLSYYVPQGRGLFDWSGYRKKHAEKNMWAGLRGLFDQSEPKIEFVPAGAEIIEPETFTDRVLNLWAAISGAHTRSINWVLDKRDALCDWWANRSLKVRVAIIVMVLTAVVGGAYYAYKRTRKAARTARDELADLLFSESLQCPHCDVGKAPPLNNEELCTADHLEWAKAINQMEDSPLNAYITCLCQAHYDMACDLGCMAAEQAPEYMRAEGSKTKKRARLDKKVRREVRNRAVAKNRRSDNYQTSGETEKVRDKEPLTDEDLRQMFTDVLGDKEDMLPRPVHKSKRAHFADDVYAESNVLGSAVTVVPVSYPLAATIEDKNVQTCAFVSADVVYMPTHGIAGATTIRLLDPNGSDFIEVPTKGLYKLTTTPDLTAWKIPQNLRKPFLGKTPALKFRKPVVGEIVGAYYHVDRPLVSMGAVGKEKPTELATMYEVSCSTLAGSCGGVYVAATDGQIVGFHGFGDITHRRLPLFYPFTTDLVTEMSSIANKRAKDCSYDASKDLSHLKNLTTGVNVEKIDATPTKD